jgi:hypothetical protein
MEIDMAEDDTILKWITNFTECDLRKNILIPLFEKMGFHDVYENHGTGELGKDIVMWKKEGISERIDYAVIVKATKITGTAAGKGSASEVCFQIQEASGSTYVDPVNGVVRNANRFIVVTPYQIKSDAINAIKAALQPQRLDNVTQFFHGTKLIQLIKKHLPRIGLLGSTEEAHDQLRKALSADKLFIESTEDSTIYHVLLKPDTDESLLRGNILFRFSDDESGEKSKKAYEDLIKKGIPFEIEPNSIADFKLPKIIAPLIVENYKLGKIIISPAFQNKSIQASLIIENEDIYELPSLVLNCINAGTEEITLSNEQQNLPLNIKLIFNFKEMKVDMTYTISFSETNSFKLHKYERFLYGCQLGGNLKIIDNETGLAIAKMSVPGNDTLGRNIEWIKILEKLSKIQIKLNEPIFLPNHALSTEELKSISDTYAIIFEGKLPLRPGTLSMTLKGKKDDIITEMKAIAKNEAREFKLTTPADHTVNFFGVSIELGKHSIVIPNYQFNDCDLVEKANSDAECILKIKFDNKTKAYREYSHKFNTVEEKESLPTASYTTDNHE